MKIVLEDVRSIEKAEFDLPEVGLIQFIGPNSHGKSILGDVLKRINSKTILDKEDREDNVIRKGCEAAYVSIVREDGYMFMCKIHAERHQSVLVLKRPDGTKISRTLREGGWDLLFAEFGFMVYDGGDVVMQLHETFGKIPFITSTQKESYGYVESISTDSRAKDFVENYKNITHIAAKELIKKIDNNLTSYKEAKQSIVLYDHEAYALHKESLQQALDNLKGLSKIRIAKIDIPPSVELVDIKCNEMIPIPLVEIVPVFKGIPCLAESIQSINQLSEGVCPLCEREF